MTHQPEFQTADERTLPAASYTSIGLRTVPIGKVTGTLTEADVRRIVRDELERWWNEPHIDITELAKRAGWLDNGDDIEAPPNT